MFMSRTQGLGGSQTLLQISISKIIYIMIHNHSKIYRYGVSMKMILWLCVTTT